MTDRKTPDSDAWQFVTAVYGRPGVAAACLELQDKAGIDVVLLLVAGYAARRGIGLDSANLDLLDQGIREWRVQIVKPLRAVRRTLKQLVLPGVATESLRQEVQGVEIAAERLELAAIVQMLPQPAPDAAAVSVLGQLGTVLRCARVGDAQLRSPIGVVASAMEEITD